jgi:hypothetical protein
MVLAAEDGEVVRVRVLVADVADWGLALKNACQAFFK